MYVIVLYILLLFIIIIMLYNTDDYKRRKCTEKVRMMDTVLKDNWH